MNDSAEKSRLNETSEKRFEELPQETQDRIMELCSKAGMDCVSLETLRKVLKDLNNPKLPEDLVSNQRAAILQRVNGDLTKT